MAGLSDVPAAGDPPPGAEAAQRIKRWMYFWIALGGVIVLVVAGFLFAIANELESIDSGLDQARQEVSGAEGDVESLPDHIQDVNVALAGIDRALEPLPRRASKVISNLESIDTRLVSVDGALESTESSLDTTLTRLDDTADVLGGIESSLDDTAASLIDTETALAAASGDLGSILTLAGRIERRLELTAGIKTLGAGGIWRRVRFLNGGRFVERRNRDGLRAVESDTTDITAAVDETNKHLESICLFVPQAGEALPPGAVPPPGTALPPPALVSPRAMAAQQRDPSEEPGDPPPPDDGPPC